MFCFVFTITCTHIQKWFGRTTIFYWVYCATNNVQFPCKLLLANIVWRKCNAACIICLYQPSNDIHIYTEPFCKTYLQQFPLNYFLSVSTNTLYLCLCCTVLKGTLKLKGLDCTFEKLKTNLVSSMQLVCFNGWLYSQTCVYYRIYSSVNSATELHRDFFCLVKTILSLMNPYLIFNSSVIKF